jgi:glycerol uptake facilitator-like aquaporin
VLLGLIVGGTPVVTTAVNLKPKVLAELLGSALLLAVVVGSGVMGQRLAQGNTAIALLANAIATGCGLAVLIALFGPISGAHFNPLVSFVGWLKKELSTKVLFAYVLVQTLGAILGVWLAHLMFELPLFQASVKVRAGIGQWTAECVATFGLILLVRLGSTVKLNAMASWVALYITAAYWFTSSTSFANPSVTLARSLSDTFAGIHPSSVGGFVAAQLVGALLAMLAEKHLRPQAG